MQETLYTNPRELISATATEHALHEAHSLSSDKIQRLEGLLPFENSDTGEILPSIKHDIGDELWGQMLFALHQTKRWGRDETLDALNYEKFEESNLEHSAGMIRRMNLLLHEAPELEEYIGSKKDFVVGILLHDLPEALVGDMPAFGTTRESDLGQQVKRMESLVFTLMMANRISDPSTREHWIGIYRDVTQNKSSDATPRARVLRFLDKWDGTARAHEHFFPYANHAVQAGRVSESQIADHINQSVQKTQEASNQLRKMLPNYHQAVFTSFVDRIVTPQLSLRFSSAVQPPFLHAESFKSQPPTRRART